MNGKKVRSGVRTLRILETLSVRGTSDLSVLQKATGIPKPTIVRLLQTLEDAGYISHLSRKAGYCLTERVLRLSSGFSHSETVVRLAQPLLDEFTDKYKWSVGIATFRRSALRLRYSTYSRSNIATNLPDFSKRISILTTAHGRVYLSFCSPIERQYILSMLPESEPEDFALIGERALKTIVEDIKRKGYCLRAPTQTDRVMGLSVPVLSSKTAIATISVRFFRSVVSPEEALVQYLKPLLALSKKISAQMEHEKLRV